MRRVRGFMRRRGEFGFLLFFVVVAFLAWEEGAVFLGVLLV